MRLPEESTSIYDDEQRAALACLRFVRVSPGKVRDYELRDILTEYLDRQVGQDAGSARSSANLIPGEAWAWVNDLFGFSCLLRDDSASSDADKGLDVVYTDPKSRLVIDLLVADAFPEDSNVRFNIATFAEGVHVESYAESGVLEKRLHFVFKPIDIDQKRWRDHAAQLLEREKLAVAETSLPVRTLEEIALDIKNGSFDWSKDLSGVYIENFSYRRLCELTGETVQVDNLRAGRTYFAGVSDWADARFLGSVDFAGAVFETSVIDMSGAHFDLRSSGDVSFRNCRVFNVGGDRGVSFDRAVFFNPGPHSELSFEDAVLDTRQMSFSKTDMRGVRIYFFQTVAPFCTTRFVECRIDQHVDFDDAVFKCLLLLGMDQLTSLRFTFRVTHPIERLVIQNCVVRDRMNIDAVRCLSLKGSTVDGPISAPWKRNGNLNFGIIEAIGANSDSREEKSQQFLALKQNFASLGQYDHEDRAFSNFMTHRRTTPATNLIMGVLRRIGDYGASPGRLLLTIVAVWAVFAVLYTVLSILQPTAFSFGQQSPSQLILSAALLSASQLMNVGAGAMPTAWTSSVVCVAEGAVGWFLLAMFSVAIVRKTVR